MNKFTEYVKSEMKEDLSYINEEANLDTLFSDIRDTMGDDVFTGRTAKALVKKYGIKDFGQGLEKLEAEGKLKKTKKGYQVNKEDKGISKVKAIKQLGKTKDIKFKVPRVSNSSKYLKQMTTLLDHMDSYADGITKKNYMLAGDPGTGKTSFIESLGTLTGIPLVIIEAPHITQEHIINIPFLVIDGKKRKEGNIAVQDETSGTQFKIVQAESALVTTLKSKKKRSPENIQSFINQNKVLREVQPKVQFEIDLIKDRFNSILFLDEFYRTTSVKIRNVLRNILNGKIGDDKIPLGTYIIMASNFNDEGVDDIPENHDFNLMKYETPEKEDLFNYFYGKYVDNPEEDSESYDPEKPRTRSEISIKPEVFNTFFDTISQDDLGKNDDEADVRLSPRRIEQMMIYVDSQTPCKTLEDARVLIGYVENGLSNYLADDEKGKSEMLEPFTAMVKDIIIQTSELTPEQVQNALPIERTEWHEQLDAQIEAKIILGENKKYVPVVSGDPGIGKTSSAMEIARTRNLAFIQVDVSNRSAEDFSGMPNADMSGPEITVEFTEPSLYRLIMDEYNAKIEDHIVEGRNYNCILLLDEMNRTTPAVFNAMRKVLLEKAFNDEYKLPDDMMIMGAINPKGEGTIEFTSHVRDVLDIIPSSAKWNNVMNYAKNVEAMLSINKKLGFDLSFAIANGMTMLGDDFHSTRNGTAEDEGAIDLAPEEQNFWWGIDNAIIYISGREFTEAMYEIAVKTQKEFRRMGWEIGGNYDEDEYNEFIYKATEVFAEYLGMGLNMVVKKFNLEDFVPTLEGRIIEDPRFERIYAGIKQAKSAGDISMFRALQANDFKSKSLGKRMMKNYVGYMSPTQATQDLEQVIGFIQAKNESDPQQAIQEILDIVNTIKTSLNSIEDISYEFEDQINHHTKHTVKEMLENGSLPLIELLNNDKLLNSIEELTK